MCLLRQRYDHDKDLFNCLFSRHKWHLRTCSSTDPPPPPRHRRGLFLVLNAFVCHDVWESPSLHFHLFIFFMCCLFWVKLNWRFCARSALNTAVDEPFIKTPSPKRSVSVHCNFYHRHYIILWEWETRKCVCLRTPVALIVGENTRMTI